MSEVDRRRLKEWRDGRDWTQADLASRLDPPVDQPTVARWESGARRIPPGLWNALRCLDQDHPLELPLRTKTAGRRRRVAPDRADPGADRSAEDVLDEALDELGVVEDRLVEAYWIATSLPEQDGKRDLEWHLEKILEVLDDICYRDRRRLRANAVMPPPNYDRLLR